MWYVRWIGLSDFWFFEPLLYNVLPSTLIWNWIAVIWSHFSSNRSICLLSYCCMYWTCYQIKCFLWAVAVVWIFFRYWINTEHQCCYRNIDKLMRHLLILETIHVFIHIYWAIQLHVLRILSWHCDIVTVMWLFSDIE